MEQKKKHEAVKSLAKLHKDHPELSSAAAADHLYQLSYDNLNSGEFKLITDFVNEEIGTYFETGKTLIENRKDMDIDDYLKYRYDVTVFKLDKLDRKKLEDYVYQVKQHFGAEAFLSVIKTEKARSAIRTLIKNAYFDLDFTNAQDFMDENWFDDEVLYDSEGGYLVPVVRVLDVDGVE